MKRNLFLFCVVAVMISVTAAQAQEVTKAAERVGNQFQIAEDLPTTWALPDGIEAVWQDNELRIFVADREAFVFAVEVSQRELEFLAIPPVPRKGEPDHGIVEIDGSIEVLEGTVVSVLYNIWYDDNEINAGETTYAGSGGFQLSVLRSCECTKINDYCIASDCNQEDKKCRSFHEGDCNWSEGTSSFVYDPGDSGSDDDDDQGNGIPLENP